MLAALFALLLLSDAAIVALFLSLRGQRRRVAPVPAAVGSDIAEQIGALRQRAEQASAELARQQLQLRRLLNGPGGDAAPGALDRVAALTPAALVEGWGEHADPVQLVRAGLSATTAAARAGVSLEELRLALALGGPRATA